MERNSEVIDPTQIYLNPSCIRAGLYESYYFRGNSSSLSFWLKHNFIQFKKDPFVSIDATFIIFDHQHEKSFYLKKRVTLPQDEFFKKIENKNWLELKFVLDQNSYFEISEKHLEGTISDNGQLIKWNFNLSPSNEPYYHLEPHFLYRSPLFPKKKLLTRDIKIGFKGWIQFNEINFNSEWVGLCGHNWGKEHAHKYVYANCNQFSEDAYFDGYSAQILIGSLKSPLLSGGSLKWHNEWYHFRSFCKIIQHQIHQIDNKIWSITFENQNYTLNMNIDGLKSLWVELIYDHPSRKQSLIANTKNAKGNLTLFNKKFPHEPLVHLESENFELESLM